jgi:hypothetical protein
VDPEAGPERDPVRLGDVGLVQRVPPSVTWTIPNRSMAGTGSARVGDRAMNSRPAYAASCSRISSYT